LEKVRPVRIRYRSEAKRDIDALYGFIAERNPDAAAQVVDRIRDAVGLLADFPFLGHSGAAVGSRELKLPGLPYIIVYRVGRDGSEIVVVGVFHGAQLRPGQSRPRQDD
jgi:toxin ParE1/3/4